MATKCKPIPGWQTMQQASAQSGYTRQRIHQLAQLDAKLFREVYGRTLVRDPFPHIKPRHKR